MAEGPSPGAVLTPVGGVTGRLKVPQKRGFPFSVARVSFSPTSPNDIGVMMYFAFAPAAANFAPIIHARIIFIAVFLIRFQGPVLNRPANR